jgi:hypothetical protein
VNISLLTYTNETYIPIAKLAANQFNKHSAGLDIKKYIACNKFNENDYNDFEGYNLIDCNISLEKNGSHFARIMMNALKTIDTEYVLFFLEDYFLIKDIKVDVFKNLFNCIVDNNIDYVSLMAYHYDWEPLNTDYTKYNLPKDILIKFDPRYFYLFSVQPSIWKRSSLIKLFEYNPFLEVHQMDITLIKNMRGHTRHNNDHEYWETPDDFWDFNFKMYTFKKSDITKNYSFDERGLEGDYLLFLYSETIRRGRFNFNTHNNNKLFLEKYLPENNITTEHPIYGRFFL